MAQKRLIARVFEGPQIIFEFWRQEWQVTANARGQAAMPSAGPMPTATHHEQTAQSVRVGEDTKIDASAQVERLYVVVGFTS